MSRRSAYEAEAASWFAQTPIHYLLDGFTYRVVLCGLAGGLCLWLAHHSDDDDEPREKRERLKHKIRLRAFGPGLIPAALRP